MRAACLCFLLTASLARAAAADASCANHPGCAGLSGDCCPSDAGVNLACCGGSEGEASNPPAAAPAAAADPGGCAVDITAGIAAISSAAKFINYAVDDCPHAAHKRACADDISSAITDFAGASKAISSATNTCGGKDSTCSTDIINTITSLSAASETLICAASDCEVGSAGYDAFQCVVDIFDVVDTLTHFSKSIYDAVDHCGPAEGTQMCDKKTAGQRQVTIVGCEGAGCNANGDDPDCAWCVTDLASCAIAFGTDACQATKAARLAEGTDCTGDNDIIPTGQRRLAYVGV